MKTLLKTAIALVGVAFATLTAAQVTFYEHPNFQGRSFTTVTPVGYLERNGFNDRASSAEVRRDTWEVCTDGQFMGRCVILRPGRYPSLAAMGLNDRVSSTRMVDSGAPIGRNPYAPDPVAGPPAQVTFYEYPNFQGRSFTTVTPVGFLVRNGFNERASSAEVQSERWEVCTDGQFRGHCVILRPGRYPSLAAMGLSDRVSSTRIVPWNADIGDNRYAPDPSAPGARPQVTFYEHPNFQGRSFTTVTPVGFLERNGFNGPASSAEVQGDSWEVCTDGQFRGRCATLRPGRYPSLAAMGLNDRVSSTRRLGGDNRYADPVDEPPSQAIFYEQQRFKGRSFVAEQPIVNFKLYGFNDRASSVVVLGERWVVCEDARFSGRCVVLRPGRYPSLERMGLNDSVSSAQAVASNERIDERRYAPAPLPVYDSRRRGNERLYQAQVTSVRAVLETPEQRCWVERERIAADRSGVNVPGALVGAVIGGILGHQIGGGRGQDLATAGGAVAGAAVGANVGRDRMDSRDVQRCQNIPGQASPDYWDVTYDFRGQEHRIQTTYPPGPTISVNEQGEPRQ